MRVLIITCLLVLAVLNSAPAVGQGTTAFTYQGNLDQAGSPVSGAHDFEFRLFAAASGDNQVGTTVAHNDVDVSDGLFSVVLDFGAGVFDGEALYLEIRVRSTGGGTFTPLDPRQLLTPAPFALYSQKTPWDGLIDIPAAFADGVDDDTLATLSCSNGQVARWNGTDWVCAADNDTTYTAGTGLVLSGTEFSAQGSPHANVVVAAQGGGDFSSVQAALDSITDAAADNPYLVYVAPGVYSEQVTMKPYVDIEGSGEGRTIIHYTGGDTSPFTEGSSATVIGADNATLRFLTVQSDGTGNDYAAGIYSSGADLLHLLHVTAIASDGGNNNFGVFNQSSSPRMSHFTATATGGSNSSYGVFNSDSSSPTMTNVTATASDNSSSNYGMRNSFSSSPTMINVIATASGTGTANRGVHNNNDSSPTMTNVTATASGNSNDNRGVSNASSSPTMTNVTATASNASFNAAVFNAGSSSPRITNVTATASGGSNSYGIYNSESSPTIRNSALEGSTNSIHRDSNSTVKAANSQLIGPVSNGLICFNNYDENLDSVTCP